MKGQNNEFKWELGFKSMAERNAENIRYGDFIEIRQPMIDKIHNIFGRSQEYLANKTEERLDKLAAGHFLAHFSHSTGGYIDIPHQFRLPLHYGVNHVGDGWIGITMMKSTLDFPWNKESFGNATDYKNFIETVKLKHDEYYILTFGGL
jgi:hypothetical protein